MNARSALVIGVLLLASVAMVCAAFRYDVVTPTPGGVMRFDRWTGKAWALGGSWKPEP